MPDDAEMLQWWIRWRAQCLEEAREFIAHAAQYRAEGRMQDAAWAQEVAHVRFQRARNYTNLIRGNGRC